MSKKETGELISQMEHKGGAFENNLDSAREYLLLQMMEKYGEEFFVVENETLENYGPIAGASYTCVIAPVSAPEKITSALVSQTLYKKVRDNYAKHFFKEEAETWVLELCKSKDYVLDQIITLEAPVIQETWTAEHEIEQYLSESGAYVEVTLRLVDGLEDVKIYAKQIQDFLQSAYQLNVNLHVMAKADKKYIFFLEMNVLGDEQPKEYTIEELMEIIERRDGSIVIRYEKYSEGVEPGDVI